MQSLEPAKKLTPMMEQYRSLKAGLPPDTMLFFRLGDFYEMFFEDALRASEILNITLTGREAGEAGRVPMCGVPHHSFQGYVRTLISKNLKVAICEQVGDPKAAKGLMERKINRIISPATYLEDELRDKSAEYLASVVEGKGFAAIAYLELSTGEFFVRTVAKDKMIYELAVISPREVVLSKSKSCDEIFTQSLKNTLNATVTVYDDWIFEYQEALHLIQEVFKLPSERSLDFHDQPVLIQAAGVLLYYLRDHLHTSLDHLSLPKLIDESECMVLDSQTQRSLELIENLKGEKENTLFSLLDQTLTCMGGRILQQWISHPFVKIEAILFRQQAVTEFHRLPESLGFIRNQLRGIRDLQRILSRLNYGVANGRDLVNMKVFLSRVPTLRQELEKFSNPVIRKTLESVQTFEALFHLIDTAIVEDPPLGVKDGGLIKPDYFSELEELRKISSEGKNWLSEFERREMERTGIKSLKIKYSQVFGYTIDISKSYLHLVPEGYLRKQTLANGERFILPELQNWDEKISGAEDKIKSLEYQLFDEVRKKVLENLRPLQAMSQAIGELDALSALAVVALQKKWTAPKLAPDSRLQIQGGRHPVVENALPAGQFVENDTLLDLDGNQLIILTGPNMAGKSTYLRQVAQLVLLAQIGSYIPADRAEIGIVDRIFTRIGAADDLARGESTFMVEMLETAHILRSCTSKSLIIFDEVGRGTSTFDGVSIAWAICESLVKGEVRPRTLFATHYHELTQLEEHFSPIKNYHLKAKETKEQVIFLRKVVRGSADKSYGIHVAQLSGIHHDITRRAEDILMILENEYRHAKQVLGGVPKSKDQQPSLFSLEWDRLPQKSSLHPVLVEIQTVNPECLTPIQALQLVFQWSERLKREGLNG